MGEVSDEDARALHSMFPSCTLVRLIETLRHQKGNMKRATRTIRAEIQRSYRSDLMVAIVGGGIGGLALALALQHRGVRCRVFERDNHFDERSQGYGLTMQQGTSALRSLGFSITSGDSLGLHSTRHLVLTSDGRQVGEWGARKWGRDDAKKSASKSNFHISRQSLRRLLLDALRPGTVAWGHRFVRYVEPHLTERRPRADTASPPRRKCCVPKYDTRLECYERQLHALAVSPVRRYLHPPCVHNVARNALPSQTLFKNPPKVVEFALADGSLACHEAHVVVGCDGINGSVRKQLMPDDSCPLQYLGVLVMLGIAENLAVGSLGAEILDGKTALQMSDGNTRLFCMPFDVKRTMWQLSFPMEEEEAAALSRRGSTALRAEALRRCGAWAAPIPTLLHSTDAGYVTGYPVFDRLSLTPAAFVGPGSEGCGGTEVTLLGDAVHPMSPFKGQGANQALADAVVLAKELCASGASGPRPALRRYEREMLERSARKVEASREAAHFLHTEVAVREGDKTRAAVAAGR